MGFSTKHEDDRGTDDEGSNIGTEELCRVTCGRREDRGIGVWVRSKWDDWTHRSFSHSANS